MTTAIGSQPSTASSASVQTANVSSSSTPATSQASASSLDAPAVTAPPRDFAAEARQIARNFERAQRNGDTYQRFQPPTTTITNEAGEEITVPVDPQESARNAVREFERQQRNRQNNAPDIVSPSQRLLSVERQDVDILIAERSAANALNSLANTLSIAQSNASNFYDSFRASNGVNSTGSRFSFSRFA